MKDILTIKNLSRWAVSIVFITIMVFSMHLSYAGRGGHVGGHTNAHTGNGHHNSSHSTGSKGSSTTHTQSGHHTSNSSSGGHANHSPGSHTSTSSAHIGESSGVHTSSGHHNAHTGENSNHINAQFRAGNHPITSTTKPYTTVNKQPLTSNRVLRSGLSIQTMPPLKTSTGLNSATVTKLQPHLSKQQVQPVKTWKAEPIKKHEVSAPYKRPAGATTKKQRESVQNKPCVDCGIITSKQYADHKIPLVKEYYQTGKVDKIKMRKIESVQPQCPTCSAKQGAEMSRYSKKEKKERGL